MNRDEKSIRRQPKKEARFQHNQEPWAAYWMQNQHTPFIEGQQDMQQIAYGGGFFAPIDRRILGLPQGRRCFLPASKNACKVIALYNCLVALHGGKSPIEFPILLREFEYGGIRFGGLFGTSTRAIRRWLTRRGYPTTMLRKRNMRHYLKKQWIPLRIGLAEEAGEVFLVTFWNHKHNPFRGMHSVAVTAGESGYLIHNLYGNHQVVVKPTIQEAILAPYPSAAFCSAIGITLSK